MVPYAGPKGFAFCDHFIRFQLVAQADSKFIAYQFKHRQVRSQVERGMVSTAGQHTVSQRTFEKITVELPPLSEQHRIVAAIETHFSCLDAAVASLTRAKANVKRARASVLKAAVEGRLVPTEAELARAEGRDYEPASELLARILVERKAAHEAAQDGAKRQKKYVEPVAPETEGLPELPEGWCWATPGQLGSGEHYDLAIGPFGSNLKVPDYRDAGVPLIFVRNVRAEQYTGMDDKFIGHQKADELIAHRVKGGDIVITKMGEPPGDASLYPRTALDGIITADVIKWTTARVLPAVYYVYATGSSLIKRQFVDVTQGVAQKKVSLERFRRIAYPIPPLAEQHHIVAEVERHFSVLDVLDTTLKTNLARCARLRQSILKRAFEGRLVPVGAVSIEEASSLPQGTLDLSYIQENNAL